jgi:hypothetical protein
MELGIIADMADAANIYLLAASIVFAVVALIYMTRTKDGKTKIALVAIMVSITLTLILSFIQLLMRRAGFNLDIIYVFLFFNRSFTLIVLAWLVYRLAGIRLWK